MSVLIKQQLVTSRAATSSGRNNKRFITIHETGNPNKGADAQAHANLQSRGNSREASWHYQVDDKVVIQSFPHDVRCWHTRSSKGNSGSIGIEICVNSDGDFKKAVANAAELVKKIMKDEGIPLSNVVQHNYWSGKNCPTNLRNGAKGIGWSQFKSMVQKSSGSVSSGGSVAQMQTPPDYPFHLKQGDVGALVRFYQDKLNRAGYPLVLDGSFGPAMNGAVRKFQGDNGLVVDGYLGPATQNKLEEVLSKKSSNKGVEDAMAEKLPKTQQVDMEKLLKKAYDDGVLLENHSGKAKNMSRGEAVDLLISFVSRDYVNE